MAQIDDLNAAEAQEQADIKALTDSQNKAFADLEAAVAAGKTGPDLAPIIAQLQANHTSLVSALVAAQAADATTQVAPPTTTTPPAVS